MAARQPRPVLLERRTEVGRVLPVPASSSVEWTIMDADWTALATPGPPWLSALLQLQDQVVLVTNATVPGLRRLESCADLVVEDVVGVIVEGLRFLGSRAAYVRSSGVAQGHLRGGTFGFSMAGRAWGARDFAGRRLAGERPLSP